MRLSALKSTIPEISEKMLIQELKFLVDSCLVERKSYKEMPPKVEYSLTEIGEKVRPIIFEMVNFAKLYEESLVNPLKQ